MSFIAESMQTVLIKYSVLLDVVADDQSKKLVSPWPTVSHFLHGDDWSWIYNLPLNL